MIRLAATSAFQFSALRSGASTATSAVDTVANISEHATEAEKRVIRYETDAYSVYTKGSYNKAPKPNYGPLARDVAGDNRGAALKGSSTYDIVEVEISRRKYPESAKHIEDAIANGQPEVLTIDRAGKKANLRASLKGIDKVPGNDLDEYPPAMFKEGGIFALNAERFSEGIGEVWYFAPDTLAWEYLGMKYSEFIAWTAQGNIDEFYSTMRWSTWKEECKDIKFNEAILIYPFLWPNEI